MQIAQSKTRDQYPLSPKKIIKKTLAGAIGLAIFLPLISLFFSPFLSVIPVFFMLQNKSNKFDTDITGIVGISILIYIIFYISMVVLTYYYQRWYFAVYFYDLTDDHIIIKKGPITPKEITIPYERVQDVYVDQDIFDRIFGLYDVHLSSATFMSGMQAHIDGVEKPAADGLKAVILQKVNEKMNRVKTENLSSSNPSNTPSV